MDFSYPLPDLVSVQIHTIFPGIKIAPQIVIEIQYFIAPLLRYLQGGVGLDMYIYKPDIYGTYGHLPWQTAGCEFMSFKLSFCVHKIPLLQIGGWFFLKGCYF